MTLVGSVGKFAVDLFTFMIYLWLLPILRYIFKGSFYIDEEKEFEQGSYKGFSFSFWLLAFLLGANVLSLKYLILPTVQGYDVPFYIDWANKLAFDGLISKHLIVLLGRVFTIFLVLLFIKLTGSVFSGIMITNVFLAGLHVAGIFLLTSRIKGYRFGFLASLFTSFSFFFYRLYLDLIANQTSWAFAPYVLYLYYCIFKEGIKSKLYVVGFVSLSVIVAFSHIWSAGILFLILVVDYLVFSRDLKGRWKRNALLFIIAFIPPILFISLINPSTMLGILNILIFGWGKGFLERELFITRENPLILVLSLIGAYSLSINLSKKYSILYLYYAVIGLFLVSGFYLQPYRLTILLPWGVLSAFGFEEMKKWVASMEFRVRLTSFRSISTKRVISVLILVLVIFSSPSPFIRDHVATPSEKALKQLEWVRDTFGYENRSIVLLVNKEVKPRNGLGWSNYYRWVSAIIGDNYYSGSILDYIQGLYRVMYTNEVTEKYYRGLETPDLDIEYIIVLDSWYAVTDLERSLLREVSEGVFIGRLPNIHQIEDYLSKNSLRFYVADIYYQIYGNDNYVWFKRIENKTVELDLYTLDNSTPLTVEIPTHELISIKGEGVMTLEIETSNVTRVCFVGEYIDHVSVTNYTSLSMRAYYSFHVEEFEDLLRLKLLIYPPLDMQITFKLRAIYVYR